MLKITIPARRLWDEKNEVFVYTTEHTLHLEHSLVSLSKWESKYCKSFLSKKEKTPEETIDYVRFMTLDSKVDPNVYLYLTNQNVKEIEEYISAPMTATYFPKDETGKTNKDTVTAELIYYWMIALNIPFECQKWHLNRLIALIRVCEMKNAPSKMSKQDVRNRHAAINAARRKKPK